MASDSYVLHTYTYNTTDQSDKDLTLQHTKFCMSTVYTDITNITVMNATIELAPERYTV